MTAQGVRATAIQRVDGQCAGRIATGRVDHIAKCLPSRCGSKLKGARLGLVLKARVPEVAAKPDRASAIHVARAADVQRAVVHHIPVAGGDGAIDYRGVAGPVRRETEPFCSGINGVAECDRVSAAKHCDSVHSGTAHRQRPGRTKGKVATDRVDFTARRPGRCGKGDRRIECHQAGALVLDLRLRAAIVEKGNDRSPGVVERPTARSGPAQSILADVSVHHARGPLRAASVEDHRAVIREDIGPAPVARVAPYIASAPAGPRRIACVRSRQKRQHTGSTAQQEL